VALGLVIKIKN